MSTELLLDAEIVDDTLLDDSLEAGSIALLRAEEAFESAMRLMDTYDVLTSVDLSVSNESYIKPLIDLTLAGTGITVTSYSSESFLDVVKSMASAVLEAIKAAFKWLMDAIMNFDLTATWLTTNINLLKRRLKTSRGKHPKVDKVVMGNQHRYLRTGTVFADSSSKLFVELRNLRDALKIVTSDLPREISSGGKAVISKIANKTNDELAKAVVESVLDIGFNKIVSRLSMSNAPDSRFGRSGVKQTSPLLGGKSIFFLDGDIETRGISGLRYHGFRLDNTFNTQYNDNGNKELNTLTYSDLAGIPDLLDEIVMMISNSSSRTVRSAFKSVNNDLENMIKRAQNSSSTSEADMRNLRTTANAFLSWTRSTIPPLYGNTLQVVRSVLSYAQLSVKTYK